MSKPSLPQGTRDFGPDVVRKRNFIFSTIKNVFELYGFQPLETPAMENIETLMGKYGEEGDKLIFRVLESGNPFSKDFIEEYTEAFKNLADYFKSNSEFIIHVKKSYPEFENIENPFENNLWDLNPSLLADIFNAALKDKKIGNQYLSKLKNEISFKALKYDLTIPFARYVAMNHTKLTFPFKRYQVQPVWRADRPQKGRYREFYQCDADVVGSTSLMNEVELACIYNEVFTRLGIKGFELKINHRKILTALAEICGGADKMMDITIAIDKLDKIGLEKVKEELQSKGLNNDQVSIVEKYLSITGSNEDIISGLQTLIGNSDPGKKGIDDISSVLDNTKDLVSNLPDRQAGIKLDPTLARGLNYYTGIIFEAKAPAEVKIGSIGGGGRYDDLTGLFGVPNIPGVGISFGVDRIYDVMEELDLFPATIYIGTQVLFFNLGNEESKAAFALMQQLRSKGVSCELFHEQVKFDKQFKYAEKKNIPFVVILGSKELEAKSCSVKNLSTGEQLNISWEELTSDFSFNNHL
ncbi:MAG: histidine--tRNA ligase [Bacteroidetes bacterium]|nr:MAG: histidine--tRNA ligase [Bacteroidota bacterium]